MKAQLLIGCLIITMTVRAQMAINTDGSQPDNSAILDLKSTVKGILIPRMSLAQRNAIINPASALVVFQTDNSPGLYYNSGDNTNPLWVLAGTSGGWNLTGNSGASPDTCFIGTTDNSSFILRVSNLMAGIIDPLKSNTGFGKHSLALISTGNFNTAFGTSALANNTTGQYNSAFGYSATSQNNTGNENTALGTHALSMNTSGSRNLAIGYYSLTANTTGNSNVAAGERTLYSSTTRNNIVAIGDSSLFWNGMNATQPEHALLNTAIGSMVLFSNTIGFGNTSAGRLSLAANTTGSNNTVSGTKSMLFNTSGSSNTAIGLISLYSLTSASGNTSIGFGTLYYATEGCNNTSDGMFSSFSITTGFRNTALGYYSLIYDVNGNWNVSLGQQSLASNVTGNYNTAIGLAALGYTNADYNTGVGYSSGLSYPFSQGTFMGSYAYPEAVSLTNCLALGSDARVEASNKYVIGKWSVTSIGGYANWTTFSDGRFKKNIRENVPGLDFINRLRPVSYMIDTEALNDRLTDKKGEDASDLPDDHERKIETCKDDIVFTGFIAQEVAEAARQTGYNFSGIDFPANENDFYRLRYEEFVVPLVKAIQELNKRKEANIRAIRELKQRIETLENK